MPQLSKNRILLLAALVLILLLIVTIPEFPYTVKNPCYFAAQVEWSLIQTEPDKFLSTIYRNDLNRMESLLLLQFDRQDFVQFNMKKSILEGITVRKGDPIARLQSSENELMLSNLLGELRQARANLAAAASGEKPAIQDEAQKAVEYARLELKAFQDQFQRKKQLYEQNLISEEEWTVVKSTHDLYRKNVNLQQARLAAVQTGAKPQEIESLESDIARLRDQIDIMRRKMSMGEIHSPLSGMVSNLVKDSLLCKVNKADTIVIQVPVRTSEKIYITTGMIIDYHTMEDRQNKNSRVGRISSHSTIINGQPMVIVSGIIPNKDGSIQPGTTGFAKIQCENITLIEHLRRAWIVYVASKNI
jgi:hypothetical protein